MHTTISADQLRTLLNDTRIAMSEQPWIQATDDQKHEVMVPHGKMEALERLQHDEWVFIPVVRTQKKPGSLLEHGFEIHRRASGWEVHTAVLETNGNKLARIHEESARNHAVNAELEKLRLVVGEKS
ncbi:MAG: hypothetical protein K9N62_19835 [Verrucomicrobia bacterium]|jgi:DNA-directed RNA polymerase subunit H (RpoH/RPB5)|nr:hypothetical protein [Verrucomicrobiota bacterium]